MMFSFNDLFVNDETKLQRVMKSIDRIKKVELIL